MPLRKKKKFNSKIIIWALILVLVTLMIIAFPPAQNVTEIVVYPS